MDYLLSKGYCVLSCGDGLEGLELAGSQTFDVIVLDVNLPSLNGFDVCRNLRTSGINTPLLILSARTDLKDKIIGLKTGADDYMTKPFEIAELQARLEALMRRSLGLGRIELQSYNFAGIHVNFGQSRLKRKGRVVALSELECRLLRYLVEHRGMVLTRDDLLQHVWNYDTRPALQTRTVDVHIVALRHKIEEDPKTPRYIETVYGEGYRFNHQ
jgi:DNA-binding response OmpR family regulator